MIKGHGDDIYRYKDIRLNFSSNVYNRIDHSGLNDFLSHEMACIRSYPEPEPYSLEKAWAAYFHTDPSAVCVTNGATEAIYLIAQVYRESSSVILMPTFSEYADACRLHQHRIRQVFSLQDISMPGNGICWLCNPNNPTGETYDVRDLRRLVTAFPKCLFVIDQSYAPFTDKEVLSVPETVELPNVLLLHSMTKQFAVPGLRLGGVTGNPVLIQQLKRSRMPWSVNALAIKAGLYLLEHETELQPDLVSLLREKDRVAEALEKIGGLEVWNSDTHYMLVCLHYGKASALKQFLAEEKGILIRDASNFTGLDERFFRIAIQSSEENDELIESIKEWMYL